jgi:hypothetical protein
MLLLNRGLSQLRDVRTVVVESWLRYFATRIQQRSFLMAKCEGGLGADAPCKQPLYAGRS